MSVSYEKLGMRIKERRKQLGWSQSRLAEIAEMDSSYISLIEGGKKQIGLDKLISVSKAVGATLDELLMDTISEQDQIFTRELWMIVNDCTQYERSVIKDVVLAVKESLRTNDKG